MSKYLFSNNATSTLAGSITSIATTATLATGAGVDFPSPGVGEVFSLTLSDVSNPSLNEIVYVTNRTGDVLTIVRGQEGTTNLAWSAGSLASNLITDGYLESTAQQGGQENYALATGTGNAYVVALDPPITDRVTGMPIRVKINTIGLGGATTLNYGAGAVAIKCRDGTNPRTSDFVAGDVFTLIDNGTNVLAMELLGNRISYGITDNSTAGTTYTIGTDGSPSWLFGGVAAFQSGVTGSSNILTLGGGSPAYSISVHNSNNPSNTANNASSLVYVGSDAGTSRSINAGGSVNASGSDYADYETKAKTCGDFAKGAIVGFDADGYLTDKFSKAVGFGVKSTDPSYVGGDRWGTDDAVGEVRPVEPKPPGIPGGVPEKIEGEPNADFVARKEAWDAEVAAYGAALAAHPGLVADYEKALEAFMAKVEVERAKVDRIAKAGKVPCIVAGTVKVGDYVVASKGEKDSIVGVAASAPTDEQRANVVGRVRTAKPSEERIRKLISKTVAYDPNWSAIVDVITS